ncbi:MAG: hypothetical protein IBX72_03645 [Nitrospirae bacterium]|nr:hypothetical protein [Nitrospirota bacterium]
MNGDLFKGTWEKPFNRKNAFDIRHMHIKTFQNRNPAICVMPLFCMKT